LELLYGNHFIFKEVKAGEIQQDPVTQWEKSSKNSLKERVFC